MRTFKHIAKAVAVVVTIVAVIVGAYFGYWVIERFNQSNRYEVNTHSQQYQSMLVDAERDRVTAYYASNDVGQRTAIANVFCASYAELDPPTDDLVTARDQICS
jgi:Na+/glutamate symporter